MLIVLSHHGNTNHNYFESLRPSSRNGYYDKRAQAGEDRTKTEPYVLTAGENVGSLPVMGISMEFSKTRTPHDDTGYAIPRYVCKEL